MAALTALRLLFWNVLWRITGWDSAGRRLVAAVGSGHEIAEMIAGMMLVRAGGRSLPLLTATCERGTPPANVLTIIGDIGDPDCRRLLERFTGDDDPQVAHAAREAIAVMESPSAE